MPAHLDLVLSVRLVRRVQIPEDAVRGMASLLDVSHPGLRHAVRLVLVLCGESTKFQKAFFQRRVIERGSAAASFELTRLFSAAAPPPPVSAPHQGKHRFLKLPPGKDATRCPTRHSGSTSIDIYRILLVGAEPTAGGLRSHPSRAYFIF